MSKPKAIDKLSYEEAQAELQDLLAQIESQSIPLDALLATYQRSQALLAHCRSKLAVLEQQMQSLSEAAPAAPSSAAPAAAFDAGEDGIPF